MGVIYSVGCRQCGVWRDLDRFNIGYEIRTHEEASVESNELLAAEHENARFGAVLLCSFMRDHYGHDCVLMNDLGPSEAELGFPTEEDSLWYT